MSRPVESPYPGAASASALARTVWANRWAIAIVVAFAAACGLVTSAYRLADAGNDTGVVYAVFWLGIAVFALPAFVRLVDRGAGRRDLLGILFLLAMLTALPKVLRSAGRPVFHDEVIHWRQTDRMRATGDTFNDNPVIPIIKDFPMIHGLVDGLSQLTGLGTWTIATGLTVLLRPLALFGIATLGRSLGLSTRTATIAAALYAMNPNFLFFDGQFAYESVGVVLVIWALAGIGALVRGSGDRRAWITTIWVLSLAVIVTHHLSSYVLVIVTCLTTLGIAWAGFRKRRLHPALAPLLAISAAQLGSIVAWTLARGAAVSDYLGPVVLPGLRELGLMLLPWLDSANTRVPFGESSAPIWARAAALISPVLLLGVFVLGCWQITRTRSKAMRSALAVVGTTYFVGPPTVYSSHPGDDRRNDDREADKRECSRPVTCFRARLG